MPGSPQGERLGHLPSAPLGAMPVSEDRPWSPCVKAVRLSACRCELGLAREQGAGLDGRSSSDRVARGRLWELALGEQSVVREREGWEQWVGVGVGFSFRPCRSD